MIEELVQLETPIVDGGNRFVNFFEGRVLTGRDLRDQQRADYRARQQLGKRIGAGIAFGLTVDFDAANALEAIVDVAPGLAVNRDGEPVELDRKLQLRLTRAGESTSTPSGNLFVPCALGAADGSVQTGSLGVEQASGDGLYVLTIAPASTFEESAPKSGLDDGGVGAGCGRRYDTRGVQFRLLRIEAGAVSPDTVNLADQIEALVGATEEKLNAQLRNRVAHALLGDVDPAFPQDPFRLDGGGSSYAPYGLFDYAPGVGPFLASCEVPLAVLHWTAGGIRFLDRWSVCRRSLALPPEAAWPAIAAELRRANEEARWFQFHAHLVELAGTLGTLDDVAAQDYFRFLPACGLLPVDDGTKFFESYLDGEPLTIPHAQVAWALERGRQFPHLDLDASPSIRLFAVERDGASLPYVLYQSAEIPSLAWLERELTEALEATNAILETKLDIEDWEAKCEQLEAKLDSLSSRLDELENDVFLASRPGTIKGTVTGVRYNEMFADIVIRGTRRGSVVATPVKVPAGVTVTLTSEDGATTEVLTDADGQYVAADLPAGKYTVAVDTKELVFVQSSIRSVVLDAGETEVVDIELDGKPGRILGDLDFEFPETEPPTLELRDVEGNLIQSQVVRPGGEYEFVDVPPGVYVIHFDHEGFDDVQVAFNGGTYVNQKLARRRG